MRKIVFLLLFVFFSCAERELPVVPEDSVLPVIEKHIVPEFINPDKSYTISVQVKSSTEIEYVKLEIYKEGTSEILSEQKLYDDGAAVHKNDGDVIAHDGLFTQVVKWETDEDAQQNIVLEFVTIKDNEETGEPLLVTVISQKNIMPEIFHCGLPRCKP